MACSAEHISQGVVVHARNERMARGADSRHAHAEALFRQVF
jgi:hypothetical protein